MRPPPSFIAGVFESPWMRRPGRRRAILGAAAVLFALLSLWPEPYAAESELMPQDNGGGLSGVLAEQASGAILNLGALAGNKPSIEADLTIARSHQVMAAVVDRLHLVGRPGYSNPRQAEAKLKHKVGIIAIRGSIVQITTHDYNANFARQLAATVAEAVQNRLGQISLQEAQQKRLVATNRLAEATVRLARAQDALNQFRLTNKLPAPEAQLGAGVNNLAGLQAQLQAKQVELRSLEQVAAPDNIQVKVVQSQIASLERQVAAAQGANRDLSGVGIGAIANVNTQYYNLYRDEKTAEILYQVYNRYLEELTIDEMSANDSMYIIEPAYLNPNRQFNVWAVGLLLLVLMTAGAAEYYAMGPSLTDRRGARMRAL